jgi:hypothetical protein
MLGLGKIVGESAYAYGQDIHHQAYKVYGAINLSPFLVAFCLIQSPINDEGNAVFKEKFCE